MFHHLSESIFGSHLSRQLKELYLSTTILGFASSLVAIFEPIYLYKIGFSVPRILLFFLAIYALHLVLAPFGGKLIRARGYEHGMIYGAPFLILYYLSLFALKYHAGFIVLAVLAVGLFKTLYWPGFHADFARSGADGERGRELGAFVFLGQISGIAGPLLGGIIINFFGFAPLFITVSLLILASNVPLLTTPEIFAPREMFYVDAFKRMLRKEHRSRLVASFGFGEDLLNGVVWPIFMFMIVGGVVSLGGIATASALATAVLALVVGRFADRHREPEALRLSSFFTAISWAICAIVATPVGVLVADTAYKFSRRMLTVPYLSMTYAFARQYSVTKTAIFLEMTISVAKMVTALAAIALLVWFPERGFAYVFILAGALSLLYGLLPKAKSV